MAWSPSRPRAASADRADHRPLRATLERLAAGRNPDELLVKGPRCGVITTATLRDATAWDDLVADLALAGLVRHGLRHTALTWMADVGVELHLLQRVAGHQDPAVTARYLHPDHEDVLEAGRALSAWWARQVQAADGVTNTPKPAARSGSGPAPRRLGVVKGRGFGA